MLRPYKKGISRKIGWLYNKKSGGRNAISPRRKRFLSLGLLPALCGMGKGPGIMEQILAYAEKAGETALYMEVRSFNQRAIRCYQKVGFVEVDQYDKTILGSSYRMLQMQYHF